MEAEIQKKMMFERLNGFVCLLGAIQSYMVGLEEYNQKISEVENLLAKLQGCDDQFSKIANDDEFSYLGLAQSMESHEKTKIGLQSTLAGLKAERDHRISGKHGLMKNKLIGLMFERHRDTGKSEWPINWYLNSMSKLFLKDGKTSWQDMLAFLREYPAYHPQGLEKEIEWATLKERVVRYRKLCKIENKPTTVQMSRPIVLGSKATTPKDVV